MEWSNGRYNPNNLSRFNNCSQTNSSQHNGQDGDKYICGNKFTRFW